MCKNLRGKVPPSPGALCPQVFVNEAAQVQKATKTILTNFNKNIFDLPQS